MYLYILYSTGRVPGTQKYPVPDRVTGYGYPGSIQLLRVKIDFLVSVWSHQKSLIIKQEGVPRRTLAMLLY